MRENKKEGECKHKFVKYPPKIGKLKVCKKCGFLWVLGDVKFGEHSIKLSGAGNYIETNTTTAPANPASGKIRLYATSGTSLKMKDSAGTETDLAAPGGDLYNFLTNPGFEIWQRGAGAFTGNFVYTADRWQTTEAGTDTISVSREGTIKKPNSLYAAAITFTFGSGAGNSLLKQRLKTEDLYGLLGRTITLRISVRANAANAVRAMINIEGPTASVTYSTYHTGGSTFEDLDVTVTVPTDATNILVGIALEATVTVYLDNATLVIGSTAQTYYPLHPAEEWERCQRYYEVSENDGATNSHPGGLGFYASAGAESKGWGNYYAVRKAVAAPTVTKNGTWVVTNCGQPIAQGGGRQGHLLYANSSASGLVNFYANSSDDTMVAEANP